MNNRKTLTLSLLRRRSASRSKVRQAIRWPRRSPLNASGEFYFEDLPPGDHPGVASWKGGTCRATIHMPDKAPPMTDAGVVTCVEEP